MQYILVTWGKKKSIHHKYRHGSVFKYFSSVELKGDREIRNGLSNVSSLLKLKRLRIAFEGDAPKQMR